MLPKIDSLKNYVNNPEEELKNITSSFVDHVKMAGRDTSYRPRLVFFDFFGNKTFGIVARPYTDATDYMSCIAEMMYAYSALKSDACVLVLDTFLLKNNERVGSCLYCYFIGDKSAHIVCLPYSYSEDQIVWDTPQSTFQEVDLKNHDGATQQMIELLYSFSHLDQPPFSLSDLLSYYSSVNYQFKAFRKLNISYIDYTKTK
jgi:hypothetical protein